MESCEKCKYCLRVDEGYSNWTVEGTTAHCLLGLNPGMPKDMYYGEEPVLKFADTCNGFAPGDGPHIDVDREDLKHYDDKLSTAYTDDPEIKGLLDRWEDA